MESPNCQKPHYFLREMNQKYHYDSFLCDECFQRITPLKGSSTWYLIQLWDSYLIHLRLSICEDCFSKRYLFYKCQECNESERCIISTVYHLEE